MPEHVLVAKVTGSKTEQQVGHDPDAYYEQTSTRVQAGFFIVIGASSLVCRMLPLQLQAARLALTMMT